MRYPLRTAVWVLRHFNPEFSHHMALNALKLLQRFRGRQAFRGYSPSAVHGSLPLGLSNRLGLAAGFDKNAEVFIALEDLGFSFIELGTVTPEPQPGNPKPRIWRRGTQTLVNHLGFNNCGVHQFRQNIIRDRARLRRAKLFANLGKGRDTLEEGALDDYRVLLEKLKDTVDAFVINISSPNTPGLQNLQNLKFIQALEKWIPENTPCFLKLSPDLSNNELVTLSESVNSSQRYSGLVLTNTSQKLAQKMFRLPQGGLSGEWLFDRALECVKLVRRVLSSEKIIIGAGGITSGERAYKMRQAGADMLEIYTGFVSRGPELIGEILEAIKPLENG